MKSYRTEYFPYVTINWCIRIRTATTNLSENFCGDMSHGKILENFLENW